MAWCDSGGVICRALQRLGCVGPVAWRRDRSRSYRPAAKAAWLRQHLKHRTGQRTPERRRAERWSPGAGRAFQRPEKTAEELELQRQQALRQLEEIYIPSAIEREIGRANVGTQATNPHL